MERLSLLSSNLTSSSSAPQSSLSITDHRTNKSYNLKVQNGFILATDLAKLKDKEGRVLRSYDPGYMNTINCTSKISYIDGDKGILEYRGIPIEQLAEHSTFLEVAFLLIFGELPTKSQLDDWEYKIMSHNFVHKDVERIQQTFQYDAHPMGLLVSTLAAMGTFQKDANPALAGQDVYNDPLMRNKQIVRLIGIMPTIAANAYRLRIGRNFNMPQKGLGYVENFLYMMDRLNEKEYVPNKRLTKALETLFILHAEHELNCSTAGVRHLASSGVDVYSAVAGGAIALYGPLHGGANEAVLRMLEQIADIKNIPQFIQDVKDKKKKLMGFGHRVYKNYDPRAKIVKNTAYEVFDICGKEPLIEIAIELERIALQDEYFVQRKLYPNVDFYSGLIYKALGFPTDMFTVLFALPRMVGWISHWNEFLDDKENKIVRPRQNYVGYTKRDYQSMEKRQAHKFFTDIKSSSQNKRRDSAEVQK